MSESNETSSKDWRDELMAKYDDMFGDRKLSMTQTCMCWGLEVNDGWKKLLEDMCAQLKIMQDYTGVRVKFQQVKEKYGTLRAYHGTWLENVKESDKRLVNDIVDMIVSDAERRSGYICEECGEDGIIRDGGWIATQCWKCALKEGKTLEDSELWRLSPEEKEAYLKNEAEKEERWAKYQEERKQAKEMENDAKETIANAQVSNT